MVLWAGVVGSILGLGIVLLRPDWLQRLPSDTIGQGEVLIEARINLTDHTGKEVTEATYGGKWLLVFFGFTYCPDVCPTTLNTIASVVDALAAQSNQIIPIFITVDPDRDNPAIMAEYVGAFHPKLVGLTGSSEQIAAAAKAFRIYYSMDGDKAGGAYQVTHSGILYLINPDGKYAAHFSHGDPTENISTTIRNKIRG